MKLLRTLLLVLLAVLLPARGAMAVTMLCPPASVRMQGETEQHEAECEHDVGTQAHYGDSGHEHAGSAQDHCHLCAAFCSLTPMLDTVADVKQMQLAGFASFPRLSAPAPSFLSDGQERPPRSI